MATYISVNGEHTQVVPARPPLFTARELEALVEGNPAFLTLTDGSLLIYNTTSYELGVEKNHMATALAGNVLPEQTWLAGPVVLLHFTITNTMPTHPSPEHAADDTAQTLHLYLVRFEVCDETTGRYFYDNAFLPYVKDEAELQARIAETAATRAQGQKFLGAERRVHDLTMMHEHLPATITVQKGR